MENKSHALAAGAFVLVLAALLVGMAAWLTRDTAERREYELSSREAVTGLQPQAGVRYKGVAVGKVTSIGLDRTTPGNVLIRIAIDDTAPITPSTFATLGFQGVTGLAFIQLDDTGDTTQTLAASTAGGVPRIPMRPGLMSRLSEEGVTLVTQMEQASQRANLLLAPDNQRALMAAIDNMGQAAAQLSQLSRRVDQTLLEPGPHGEAPLPLLVQQAGTTFKTLQTTAERLSASAEAVSTSATEFKRMSTRMNESGGTLDKIAQGVDVLVPRLNRTARQVGQVMDNVNENPQSLLLGKGAAPPGPGEPGFVAPPAH